MSWNCPQNRISEDELKNLDQSEAYKIINNWKILYNPESEKTVYVNPEAYRELREALLATLPYQPETKLEKINNLK